MKMKCPCCLSDEIGPLSDNTNELIHCRSCGYVIRSRVDSDRTRNQVLRHYGRLDPHRRVAASKRRFFNEMLGKLGRSFADGDRLLDIGCGFGYFLALAKERGWQVAGVEISAEAVSASKKIVGQANVFHGTTRAARFAANSFAAVTMWDALEFLGDPEPELRECFRILKPGGRLGLRIRNAAFHKTVYLLCRPFNPLVRSAGIGSPYVFHPQNFSNAALSTLLSRVGFCGIEVINSPLTAGSPYRKRNTAPATAVLKKLTAGVADAVFRISGGRRTIGPSLLVWAEKPPVDSRAYD